MDFIIGSIKKFILPLIFLGISSLLFLSSFLFSQNKYQSSDIIFTTEESSASAELSNSITVDIAGEVNMPGVYSLSPTSRVNDLIEKAGGLTSEADMEWIGKSLNRAQLLHDGDKLYISGRGDVKSDQSITNNIESTSTTNVKTNINTASSSELEELPGIGEKTAAKIIDGRPYQSIEDLRTKKIVGESVFTKIKDLIATL